MGKEWDGTAIAFSEDFWREVLRVLKPGGHIAAFGGARTYHRLAAAIEDAGFELRDCLFWAFGSGFPKSLDISKALDKQAGADRPTVAVRRPDGLTANRNLNDDNWHAIGTNPKTLPVTAPATDLARQWEGWGTALKPAVEPIVLARAPLAESTIAGNVAAHGTGALHIAACRVGTAAIGPNGRRNGQGSVYGLAEYQSPDGYGGNTHEGRWPPHLLLSHSPTCTVAACDPACPVAALDAQAEPTQSNIRVSEDKDQPTSTYALGRVGVTPWGHTDTGGVSRYFPIFYTPKASTAERNRGCATLPQQSAGAVTGRVDGTAGLQSPRAGAGRTSGNRNHHPTVKPLALMGWLIRLITPPGGIVLDCFAGSGSTLVAAQVNGFAAIGVDLDAEYVAVQQARLTGHSGWWEDPPRADTPPPDLSDLPMFAPRE